jgi:hypothetical protein
MNFFQVDRKKARQEELIQRTARVRAILKNYADLETENLPQNLKDVDAVYFAALAKHQAFIVEKPWPRSFWARVKAAIRGR